MKPPQKMINRLCGNIFLCLIFALSPSHAADADLTDNPSHNIGFREINHNDTVFGVWYPTDEKPQSMRLGPFEVNYAKNAAPAKGAMPIVVLSHGVHGYYRNHHLTAATLAQHNFVVIAPQHQDNNRPITAINKRANDIKQAIAALQQHEEIKNISDFNNINAVGYSLGGASALIAAGASGNFESFKIHCAKNYEKDKNACAGFPWWARMFLQIKSAYFPNPHTVVLNPAADVVPFQKIALVAPVGQGIDAPSLTTIRAETLIFQIADDSELRAPYHAQYLNAHLAADKTRLILIENGHHYAFIAPFPEWLIKEEHIPGAIDPPGFNRMQFINQINEKILSFLKP